MAARPTAESTTGMPESGFTAPLLPAVGADGQGPIVASSPVRFMVSPRVRGAGAQDDRRDPGSDTVRRRLVSFLCIDPAGSASADA